MFLLMMLVSSAGSCLFSQENQQKPTRQSSQDAFTKGNYEQAYAGFSELLKTYTRDPLYKYYCGACLVELKRSPATALQMMEQALQSATVVKPLPNDARFYLGRAQQMSGKYGEAIKSFNIYIDEAGRKASRGKGVEELIQQCKDGRGEVEDVPVPTAINPQKESVPVNTTDKVQKEPVQLAKPEDKPQQVNPLPAVADVSIAPAAVVVAQEPAKPPSYEKLIDQGIEFQFLADSLHDLTASQRKDIENLPEIQKADLIKKIGENEKLEASYQKIADQKFADAKAVSSSGLKKPGDTTILIKPVALETTISDPVKEKPRETEPAKPAVVKQEAVTQNENTKPEVIKAKAEETVPPVTPATTTVVKPAVELFSLFEILPGQGQASVKPADSQLKMIYSFNGKSWWDPEAKVTIDPPFVAGLIYRIQIGVFRNPVKPSFFKGLAPVYGFKIEGTDKTIYYAGMFRKLTDANKALASVKAKGFADAFTVPLLDNRKVTAERAAIMEKEWGRKPFISAGEAPGIQKPVLDTIPPALSFRVEVMKAQKPLKEDVVEGMRKVAGNRGVDILTFENGSCAYLIGKFITFESASEYSDLLIKNGYREARVVAFLGAKEIPVETAKQLFDK